MITRWLPRLVLTSPRGYIAAFLGLWVTASVAIAGDQLAVATVPRQEVLPLDIEFAYIEPRTTTAIEISLVRADVASLVVNVSEVSYDDIFGRSTLVDRHGALALLYNGATGLVINERQYELGR